MPVYKSRSGIQRYLPYAISAAKAVRTGYKVYKTITDTKRKSGYDQIGVTQQRDARTTYRRKRMPRRKRKRWVSFSRKVRAVVQKDLATLTRVLSTTMDFATYSPVSSTQQAYGMVHLNGIMGKAKTGGITDNEIGTRDLYDCGLVASTPTTSAQKVRMKASILDLTMTNTSKDTSGNTATLEVDLYHVVYKGRKNLRSDLSSVFTDAANVTAGSMTLNDRGVTPFEIPEVMSLTGMTILKKTKLFIGYGQTATYQLRDPKNHWIDNALLGQGATSSSSEINYAKSGLTQSIIFIVKTCPGFIVNPKLTVGATRAYHWTVLENNNPQEGYVNPSS